MTTKRTRHPGVFYDECTGKYGYVVRIGTDPKTGKVKWQRQRGFARQKRRGRRARAKVARAVRDGTHASPSRETVVELCERGFDVQLANGRLRATTVEHYRRQVRAYAAPAFARLRAQDLRGGHLDHLYGETRERKLAPATIRQLHNMLSRVFTRALKRADVAANPCQRATSPGSQTPETATWSVTELQAFLAHDAVRADPDYALWRFLAATGMRRGKALALRWVALDLAAGTVSVPANATLVGGQVEIGEPKTRRSRRRVKVGPDTVALLAEHGAAQREWHVSLGAAWRDVGLVFPGPDGRPQSPATVSRRFTRLVSKASMKPVTLHSLRHAHGTLLLDSGERLHDVAARLGHDPGVLLRTYAHHRSDGQDSAAALEALLDGGRPPMRVLSGEHAQDCDQNGDHEAGHAASAGR